MTLLRNCPARRLRPRWGAAGGRRVRGVTGGGAVLGDGLAQLVRELLLVTLRELRAAGASGERDGYETENREASHQFPAGHSAVMVFRPLLLVVLRV